MNINDTKRFYKEDAKKYILKNNKDFISRYDIKSLLFFIIYIFATSL